MNTLVYYEQGHPIGNAAQELADAKYRFSEAFLRHRLKAKTDTQAEHMAYVECGKELTIAEARLAAEIKRI